jgi:hypothetical protein
MTQALTFRGWLQHETDRDDPVGELARVAFGGSDPCPRGCRFSTWPAFLQHLTREHRATTPAAWAAARSAGREYHRYANRRGAA